MYINTAQREKNLMDWIVWKDFFCCLSFRKTLGRVGKIKANVLFEERKKGGKGQVSSL